MRIGKRRSTMVTIGQQPDGNRSPSLFSAGCVCQEAADLLVRGRGLGCSPLAQHHARCRCLAKTVDTGAEQQIPK